MARKIAAAIAESETSRSIFPGHNVLYVCGLQHMATLTAAPLVEGFELMQRKFVAEYDSDVLLYKHLKTGEATSCCDAPSTTFTI